MVEIIAARPADVGCARLKHHLTSYRVASTQFWVSSRDLPLITRSTKSMCSIGRRGRGRWRSMKGRRLHGFVGGSAKLAERDVRRILYPGSPEASNAPIRSSSSGSSHPSAIGTPSQRAVYDSLYLESMTEGVWDIYITNGFWSGVDRQSRPPHSQPGGAGRRRPRRQRTGSRPTARRQRPRFLGPHLKRTPPWDREDPVRLRPVAVRDPSRRRRQGRTMEDLVRRGHPRWPSNATSGT